MAYRKFLNLKFLDSLYRINVRPTELTDTTPLYFAIAGFYDQLAGGPASTRMWNWGCHNDRLQEKVTGHAAVGSDGYSEQLYARVCIDEICQSARGSVIVDIGCGAGQGTLLLARMSPRLQFIGLDLSPGAIAAAQDAPKLANARFVTGSFNEIAALVGVATHAISVESMHNYPSIDDFLLAVSRVLQPGCILSVVDMYTRTRRDALSDSLGRQGLWKLERDDDISADVRKAIAQRVTDLHLQARRTEENMVKRYLATRGREIMFGAQFLDRKDSILGMLVRILSRGRVMKLDSYRHIVLRRLP